MPKRASAMEVARRDQVITRMYLQGYTQYEIADHPDVAMTQPAVSRRLAKVRQDWRDAAIYDMNEMMGRELARIDEVEREAWAEWYRSREDVEEMVAYREDSEPYVERDDDGNPVLQPGRVKSGERQRRTGRLGDVRYLQMIAWCVEQRVKLFGLANIDGAVGAGEGAVQIEVFHRIVDRFERGELQPAALRVLPPSGS